MKPVFDFILSIVALALAKFIAYSIHIPVIVSLAWLITLYSYYVSTKAEDSAKKEMLERTRLILMIAIFVTLAYAVLWILIF